jgi:hypothetical protein
MKKIIVTPAGRKRYLEILYEYLKSMKNEFDEWILWVNTNDINDINYMEKLAIENDFIKLQIPLIKPNGSGTIYQFFSDCANEDSVYLRLDDDVIYIKPNSITDIFNFRMNNEQYFLVYGNIINNGILNHLHQRKGVLDDTFLFNYDCVDHNGWNNPKATELIHNTFFDKLKNNTIDDFLLDNWILNRYERCSINVISWLGKEFKKFNGIVDPDEEKWLSTTKPEQIKKPTIIYGNSLFVHYAFFTQRQYIDTKDILQKYKQLSLNL